MKAIFEAYVAAINSNNLETVMTLFAPDAQLLHSKYRPSKPAEGVALLEAYINETVIQQNGKIEILSIQETGETVEANVALTSDRISKIGLQRIIGFEKIAVENNKIKSLEFRMDLSDEETNKFFEFVKNLEANRPKN